MSEKKSVAISIKNLCKAYPLYSKLSDLVVELLLGKPQHTDFIALKDISFDIKSGEILGIVGTNGAGKSTLLKILSGTLNKTSGDVKVNGKISSILELGTGFHPEYTGRENIYMGGMCLGLGKREIDKKIESIIDFSGIRQYIDNPFKTYSSGMQARLTFSLVVGIDPDILIIDEALAVGDAIFVNKCISKIKEICSYATTVFVSHNLEMVRRFCTKALWLHEGSIVSFGEVEATLKAYERYIWEQSESYLKSYTQNTLGISTSRELVELSQRGNVINNLEQHPDFFKYGSKDVVITDFKILNKNGQEANQFKSGEYLEFKMCYEGSWGNGWQLHAACQIFTNKGMLVFTPWSEFDLDGDINQSKSKRGMFRFILSPLFLGAGEYILGPMLGLVKENERIWADWHDRLYSFKVISSRYNYSCIVEHPVIIKYESLDEFKKESL